MRPRSRKQFTGKVEKAHARVGSGGRPFRPGGQEDRLFTGELALDYGRGLLKVDARSVQGFVGTVGLGSLEGFRPDLRADRGTPGPASWRSVWTAGRWRNPPVRGFLRPRGGKLRRCGNATRKPPYKDPGQAPVMEQWVKGTVTLKVEGNGNLHRENLMLRGNRASPCHLVQDGELTIPLSPKNASGYYEVIRR